MLEFFNQPKGGILILKKDSQTGEPLVGVEFKVTTANGEFVANNGGLTSTNGIYTTNEDGQIEITQLKPGTYTVTETKTLEDYVLDAAPQTVVVEANDLQTLTFTNTKKGCLVITKIDSVTHEPLSGVKFKIQGCNGNPYPEGNYTTDSSGVIRLDHLPSGDYTIAEVQAKDGYRLDDTVKTINIEAGKTKEITFENEPLGGLLIRKMDASTKEPLSGVKFKITRTDGTVIGTSNGEFETDEKGYISLPDLAPGSYIVTETQSKTGYLLDNTPKTVEIKDHQLYTLDFYNQPMGGLIIHKLDSITKKPLQGVQFKITTADGTFVADKNGKLSSNGLYFTDENGQIVLSDLAPNTYIVTEAATIDGYTIDEATRSQTVVVNTDDTQTLYFYNTPISGLTLIKEDEETHARIPGVTFEVRKLNGEIIGNYTTGDNGIVVVPRLDNGWYQVVELKAAAGYKLDSTPHQVEIKSGENAQLTITNRKSASILLRKVDSVTGNGIYGVKFLISDANRNPIMEVETDQDGYIYIDRELDDGKYFIREIQPADGYIADNTVKTFHIQYGSTSEITWKNTPILAQIQIVKKSANDNTYNGFPAGTLLEGAVFEIVDKAGNVVDTVKTDARGLASSKPLPLSRYIVREIQAPDFYAINPAETTVYLEHEGQIARIEVLDESSFTNVSISKRGYTQIVPGQEIRYDFSRIANNSTVSLSSFYWRDTLPSAAPLQKIITGTYNQQLSYKIVFKTNQRDYTTLADNLLTSQNYVLDASPTALGLASNEYVTEVMFSFGTVKAGFAQVEAPHIYCKALSNLANNTSFVNQADVGGLWGTRWIMATDRWVTTIYSTQPAPKLPKTGY